MKKGKQKSGYIKKQDIGLFDLDKYVGKYIYLLIPILVIIYYVFSTFSDGFFQDDEITHLMYMKRFFQDPTSIIGQWNKAGYKLLFALPSLLGYESVHITHMFLTSITAISVYFLGKYLKIKNSIVPAILFAFQPLIFQLSFRCYSEMLAGLLIVTALIFYYKRKYIFSALCSTYLFSVRYEHAILSLILAILFLMPIIKKIFKIKSENKSKQPVHDFKYFLLNNIIPFILLGLSPIILNLIGFLKTGDPLWLINDIKYYAIDLVFGERTDLGHYFQMYIFIIGPVTFMLFIIGYLGFLSDLSKIKEYFHQFGLLFVVFTSSFLFQVIMAWDILTISSNQGQLRLLVPISPLAAIFAGIGLNNIMVNLKKPYIYITIGLISFATLIFLSWDLSSKILMTNEKEYLKFGIVISILLLTILMHELKLNPLVFISAIIVIGISYTILKEKPIKLDPEKNFIKFVANSLKAEGYNNKLTLCNHIFFYYYLGIEFGDNSNIKPFTLSTLKSSPVGSICIWDWHYSYRPEYHTDTPLEYFMDNHNFRLLSEYSLPDPLTSEIVPMILVFEKIREY